MQHQNRNQHKHGMKGIWRGTICLPKNKKKKKKKQKEFPKKTLLEQRTTCFNKICFWSSFFVCVCVCVCVFGVFMLSANRFYSHTHTTLVAEAFLSQVLVVQVNKETFMHAGIKIKDINER